MMHQSDNVFSFFTPHDSVTMSQ